MIRGGNLIIKDRFVYMLFSSLCCYSQGPTLGVGETLLLSLKLPCGKFLQLPVDQWSFLGYLHLAHLCSSDQFESVLWVSPQIM